MGYGTIVVLGLTLLAGCGERPQNQAAETASPGAAAMIKVDGSSTVFPIAEAVAEEFQSSGVSWARVTVGISGTGGGFKKFCRGETDIANASRPILKSEMDACKVAGIRYLELPIAYDAPTVAVNPANDWASQMTVAELKKLWEPAATGKVTKWSQIRAGWPDKPISLYGAGTDSGTFDYFTDAINGKAKASRTDYTAGEDDNVLVQGVIRDKFALGYFGYAYYAANPDRNKQVAILNANGTAVLPSTETVNDGSYSPLSRPVFIYVSLAAMDRPEILAFVEFYMKHAKVLVAEVQYVPLADAAYVRAFEIFREKRAGSVFGGKEEVGARVEDLLQRTTVE